LWTSGHAAPDARAHGRLSLDPRRPLGHRTTRKIAACASESQRRIVEKTMADEITETSQTVAAGQLRAFIERIERLEEEKKTISDDIKDVYAEAKGTGFDTKAIRTLIRLRKKDQAEREEEESILDLYKAALGM
jgi:uncharacterized protein (UPF0335 family)